MREVNHHSKGKIIIIMIISFIFLIKPDLNAQNAGYFNNPILPGFHPDPSICRVGEDYYLVTSSFEWFPGLPVYHSKDLVHWEQIGHVLNRPSQLQLRDGLPHSSGLWAPTIRYHDGVYYVICTATGAGGNFFVRSDNPGGPYTDPVFIADAPGIDPSLFFDDNGKVYYCGSINGSKKIPPQKYFAEDRIYVQEIDLITGKFIRERHIVTSGYAINSPYAEAPHIYKINSRYYLMIAEGGTWEDHAVTVFSSDSITGPYTPFIANPLLTHRNLGNNIDITTIGHADLVQTQFGDWYAVMLGVRPVEGFNLLGRETFLTRVVFQDGVPIFNPGIGRVLSVDINPNLPLYKVAEPKERDDFETVDLNLYWNFLRTPFTKWYFTDPENGLIRLEVQPESIKGLGNPSLIARRVQHHKFEASCCLIFKPRIAIEEAGIVITQNNKFNYRLVKLNNGNKSIVRLFKIENGNEQLIAEKTTKSDTVYLKITGNKLKYSFYFGTSMDYLEQIGDDQDATVCSTNKAKGFIGPFVGMYCSSNGQTLNKKDYAEYDWFDYREIE